MRALVTTAGAILVAAIAGVVFLWPAQGSGPQAIDYGRDACAHCRMILSRPGFAGELRDAQGTLTKYDDIGCLLRAMLAESAGPEAWVEDHGGMGFIPLRAATLVLLHHADTPMSSRIVAFADGARAVAFAVEEGGHVVALEDLLASSNAKEMQP